MWILKHPVVCLCIYLYVGYILRIINGLVCYGRSEVIQLCLTLCDPMDCNLPGSCVDGIFQARILEGVAISFSKSVNVNQNDCSNVSSLLKYEFQKLYSFGKCQTYRKDIYYNESPFVFPLHSPIANILQHLLLCLFREFILYMMWCLIQSRLQICMSRGT